MSDKDVELKREVGYTIKDIVDHGSGIEVQVETPDKSLGHQSFRFRKDGDMMEEMEYVEEGEIKRAPRWKVRLEELLTEQLDSESQDVDAEQELSEYIGERLDV